MEEETKNEEMIKTEIHFHTPQHRMVARYEGSFHIEKAVIRAKFVGDESSHSFYIGENDMLVATVVIGFNEGAPLALMVDGRTPQSEMAKCEKLFEPGGPEQVAIRHDLAELEEFTMFAVTDGRYYKNYMKPRVVNEDLAIFTCYNKTRNLLCDTVASFKNGLCDPETIFSGSNAEDVPASWARNLQK